MPISRIPQQRIAARSDPRRRLLRREGRRLNRLQISIAGLRDFCVENPGRHQRPQHLRRAAGNREHAGIPNHTFERIIPRVASGTEQLERLVRNCVGRLGRDDLRLRREDYRSEDVARWADVIQQMSASWSDAFVYFKHEESGTGPKLAQELGEILRR